jgi:hypothetical protein
MYGLDTWVPELDRSAQKLYTDVTINLRVGEEQLRQAESNKATT